MPLTVAEKILPRRFLGLINHLKSFPCNSYLKELNTALTALQEDVLNISSIFLTTFSNLANKMLVNYFQPHWIFGNEIGVTQKIKVLMPITYNLEILEMFVGVGDPHQLAPVIGTRKEKCEDGTMINQVANALVQPFIPRAQLAGFQGSMFCECFRCTEELHQPSSDLFYGGKVASAPKSALSYRLKSQKAIEFISKVFNLKATVPRLVFNLCNGISTTNKAGSRANAHNIAQVMELIEKLVEHEVFTTEEIAIQSPY